MKNKHLKSIILITVFSFSFIFLLLLISFKDYFLAENDSSKVQAELADKVLRFHVIANSDSTKDQDIKMQVKAKILTLLQPELINITSKEEAIATINLHMSEIIATASSIISQNGKNETVIASVTKSYFPTKTYDDIVFPPGIYDTLNIQIGEAKGHNWWCVMYPPLCFSDDTLGYLPADSKQILQNALSPKTYASIQTTPQAKSESSNNSLDDTNITAQSESPTTTDNLYNIQAETSTLTAPKVNAQIDSSTSPIPQESVQAETSTFTASQDTHISDSENVVSPTPKIKIHFKIFTFLNDFIDTN